MIFTMQHGRCLTGIMIGLLFLFVLAGLSGVATAAQEQTASPFEIPHPGASLWHDIRDRNGDGAAAITQAKTVDAESLIRSDGESWRQFRMAQFIPISGIVILSVLSLIVLFRLVRGKIKIKSGRSGKTIVRFSKVQRYIHWITAILFIMLGLTGLVITFGRNTLLPLLGPEIFSTLASFSKLIHNYSGPAFAVSLLLMILFFMKGNFFRFVDIKWFLKGGGFFGGHANAGFYNGGEKLWYWVVVLAGILVAVSGLVLDFPIFGQTRDTLELYHMLHAVAAIVLFTFSLGHFYMGSIAVEGAFESMSKGTVDENWAREHHNLWYEEVTGKSASHSDKTES